MNNSNAYNRDVIILVIVNWVVIGPCMLLGMSTSRLFYPKIYSSSIYPLLLFVIGLFLMFFGVRGTALRLLFAAKNKVRFLSWNSIIELVYTAISGFGFGVIGSALAVGMHLFFS